jgi:BirA family biotin operon repressor/biotin-[acetyl-CoA-carboxylase] ligase
MTTADLDSVSEPARRGSRWVVTHHVAVPTTQALARDLPAWSAVWADEQTAGRGQAERTFVSDPGGLYLTAVLPYAGDAFAARGFALAVGWAVRMALCRVGIRQLRLRWPNDLLVGAAKVGGILVEQGGPHTLLVGLGLNVTNCPWVTDPALQGMAGRLADAGSGQPLPERSELVQRLLRAIRLAHREFERRRLAGFAVLLDRCWDGSREVILEPARGVTLAVSRGWFAGIDVVGAVRLRTDAGMEVAVPAHHIQRLREAG